MPALEDALTTARMTAFRPGASPPPVRTPIFLIAVDMDDETVAPSRGRVQLKRSRGVGAGRQRASKPNEKRGQYNIGTRRILGRPTTWCRDTTLPESQSACYTCRSVARRT